jgi:phage terminase large subunit GpA-like protein
MSDLSVIQGFLDGLRPPPRVTVSEWANKNRYMTEPFPGLYRTELTPYLEEIMDQLSPYNPTQEIIFKKSSQIGATEAGNNWIGAIIHYYLGNTLMVLPTKDLATTNAKQNIEKMIDASPDLRKRVPSARKRDSGNTTLEKNFPGGFLKIVGANSANSARSTSFRWVYLDEISAYPMNVDGEGDPYKLFKGRTKAFGTKYKIFVTSTPTVEGECRITTLYEETDQRLYHITCPHCKDKENSLQPLSFDRLKWMPGNYDDVWYECIHGCRIDERHKPWMMAKLNGAKWIATKPENSSRERKGYGINALYAPLGMIGWAALAKEHDEVHKDTATDEELQAFINLQKGETFKINRNLPDWKRLYERAENYDLGIAPNEVAILTGGVDVQKDRLEVTIRGWSAGKRSYLIDYHVIPGDPNHDAVWNELREYLEKDFNRPDGGKMPVSFTCVDSGFLSERVYQFCADFGSGRCAPTKGGPEGQKTILSNPKSAKLSKDGSRVGTTMFYMLGTHPLKELFFSRLNITKDYKEGEVPRGYYYFTKQVDPKYFEGMCSEVHVLDKGRHVWKKVVIRNEPLDLEILNIAAAELLGAFRKTDEWYMEEITRFRPDRKEFTKETGRVRKKSEYWSRFD